MGRQTRLLIGISVFWLAHPPDARTTGNSSTRTEESPDLSL
jgi:hypothetical protein